jgi:transcriptional regulator with XRE-family HTH domain
MAEWFRMLTEARIRLGLSQAELAARAHVSLASVKSYEQGRRHPSRPYLIAMLDALHIDRGWRNEILEAAGFSPDGLAVRPHNLDEWQFTPLEADEEIATYAWPSFVLTERMEVIAANAVAQALWGVDMRREFVDPIDRNLLSVASNPRFAERVANWDEAIETIAGQWKGYHRAEESLTNPTPYFKAVLERFLAGDPRYVQRFANAWERAQYGRAKRRWRWSYPISWDEPGIGEMRFRCLVSNMSEIDGLSVNDWMPRDAESWSNLDRLKQRAGIPRG